MKIGVPTEVKNNEFRVGLTPGGARELILQGHQVLVQREAGLGSGLADDEYIAVGATLLPTADAVFSAADLIVKVKEPQPSEYARLRPGQVLFTYLHLAPDRTQAEGLMASGATCIAYETVTDSRGGLPLLTPMSEVAGRMAGQVAAHYLERPSGGRGILLGGVPGVEPASVVILGGGVSGSHAAQIAKGLGARVTVVDRSLDVLRRLQTQFGASVETAFSTTEEIERLVLNADAVIGAVLVPGGAAPKLVSAELVSRMRPGSVLVDVAIDQGGCFETSRATTHEAPVYSVDGVTHYCVANMPGGVPRTSTFALNNATLPFIVAIANKGWRQALLEDAHLRNGLNVHAGRVTYPAVSEALGLGLLSASDAIAA